MLKPKSAFRSFCPSMDSTFCHFTTSRQTTKLHTGYLNPAKANMKAPTSTEVLVRSGSSQQLLDTNLQTCQEQNWLTLITNHSLYTRQRWKGKVQQEWRLFHCFYVTDKQLGSEVILQRRLAVIRENDLAECQVQQQRFARDLRENKPSFSAICDEMTQKHHKTCFAWASLYLKHQICCGEHHPDHKSCMKYLAS